MHELDARGKDIALNEAQRVIGYALYAAVVAAGPVLQPHEDLYRACCQVRASLERALKIAPTRTGRNG